MRNYSMLRLGLLLFLKLLFSFYSQFRGSLVTQNVFIEKRKVDKEYAEFSKTFGSFPAFLRR